MLPSNLAFSFEYLVWVLVEDTFLPENWYVFSGKLHTSHNALVWAAFHLMIVMFAQWYRYWCDRRTFQSTCIEWSGEWCKYFTRTLLHTTLFFRIRLCPPWNMDRTLVMSFLQARQTKGMFSVHAHLRSSSIFHCIQGRHRVLKSDTA